MTHHENPGRAPNPRRTSTCRDAVWAPATAGLEDYIKKLVDCAPPLSTEQKARLTSLLGTSATAHRTRIERRTSNGGRRAR
ncbi:hypothetical protein PV646_02990 [Streptomyces sp. ID05-26A]|nr:hypothetical protein [Streptomyces sp. ID05-26A]